MLTRILLVVSAIQTIVISIVLGMVFTRQPFTDPSQSARAASLAGAWPFSPSVANAQAQPILPANLGISLAEARVVVDAATAYARSVNGVAGIAVVDGGGNVVSLDRMDGASYQQDRQAAGKARIAVMSRNRTSITAGLIETAPDRYFSTLAMFPGELFWQAGGVPLVVDGRIVGGVGVSGLLSGGDDTAADVAIEAWQRYREDVR